MKIAIGIGSESIGVPTAPQDIADQAVTAEQDGFPAAWCVHFSRGVDALSILGVAAARTNQIELGVGIVPTYPRHPLALAQQAATVQAFAGGRLTLGVGVSHKPVIEGLHGLTYASPAQHMREYLSVLGPLLRGETVSFEGQYYRVNGDFTVPATAPVSIVVGALGPKMVQIAGELADGVVTWLVGRKSLAENVAPVLAKAAADTGRPTPRIVASLPVVVWDDAAAAREAVDATFARYCALPNYQRQLERDGVSSPADLAIIGSESEVERQLRDYADLGTTEIWPVIVPMGDRSAEVAGRTRAFLRQIAPDLAA